MSASTHAHSSAVRESRKVDHQGSVGGRPEGPHVACSRGAVRLSFEEEADSYACSTVNEPRGREMSQ